MTVTETEASTETEAVASVPASDGTDDSKARRGKGELEAQVRAITDAFVRGVLYEHPGDQPLTPHMISTYIKNRFGLDKAPSAGAISANLNRWEEVGFAVIVRERPVRFAGYTPEASTVGLSELKARFRVANAERRKADKAAVAAAKAAAALADSPAEAASDPF